MVDIAWRFFLPIFIYTLLQHIQFLLSMIPWVGNGWTLHVPGTAGTLALIFSVELKEGWIVPAVIHGETAFKR